MFFYLPPALQENQEVCGFYEMIMMNTIMLLRVQFERHQNSTSPRRIHKLYGLTVERYEKMQDHTIITIQLRQTGAWR